MSDLHVHTFQEQVVLPTCKEPGYTLYKCDCGYEHRENFKPVGPHNFRMAETTPAACTEPGKVKFVCETCGETVDRVTPPLGHAFDNWSVQVYPTCTQPGRQVRRCSRCNTTEEMSLQAIGHKCAPGTARREGGRVVDFFCENCGKTIQCAQESVPVSSGPVAHKPTKTVMLVGLIVAVLGLIFLGVAQLTEGMKLLTPWISYAIPLAMVVGNIVLFAATDSIKRRESYTRWLGILVLAASSLYVLSLYPVAERLFENMEAYSNYRYNIGPQLDYILRYSVLTVIQLVLAVMLFLGKEKKYWVFAMVLYGAFLQFVIGAGFVNSNVFYATNYDNFGGDAVLGWYITLQVILVLYWVEFLMLIHPGKKKETAKAGQEEV